MEESCNPQETLLDEQICVFDDIEDILGITKHFFILHSANSFRGARVHPSRDPTR